METQHYDFGMVGLGVMGRNFLLNIADSGFSVIGLDKDDAKAAALEEEGSENVKGATTPEDFVNALKKPRKIMMLVPAGPIVDSVIEELTPLLEEGDVLIDGGNSHFTDTDRRIEELKAKNINYLGIGVSGGEEGARKGPSLMPGGMKEAYEIVRPMLEAAAAKVNGEPCVTYLGSSSAGNFVKMVHNGIEYGLMELIAEVYDLMKRSMDLSNEEIHKTFAEWNAGELQSFLVEITADIFKEPDTKVGEGFLVDKILDKAKQKGTGKWTSQVAMDLGIPIPVIDAAVTSRFLSALKGEREQAAEILVNEQQELKAEKKFLVGELRNALHFATIVTYAQGMALLKESSTEFNYGLNLADVAKIWRGGCIIRAKLLEDIMASYHHQPDLVNLMLDDHIAKVLLQLHLDAVEIAKLGLDQGVPMPALNAALAYFDAYRSKRLPSNLTQAQRDFFGAHTYERIDAEGTFHTEWNK
uniref:6-phosphogluconate dehydrogenase, decarboxylating n=1 Tax=Roseihalotalea indica TaxID=2867963 RepID=A0AA49JG85_9BACT|nr:NADP-dependent phosphogluconate dehydrogenase [Tunicatimonas sp. TK19036]